MFDLKEKMLNIYNKSDRRIPLEHYRSEGVKYIQDNIQDVIYDSVARTYSEYKNKQLINLADLFNSVRFSQLAQWSFDVIIDKMGIYQKQNQLRQENETYGTLNLIYSNVGLSENDLTIMQARLETDVEEFINTNFTKYLGELVRRK